LKQKNTQATTEPSDGAAMITVGDNSAFTSLATRLAEIRKQSDVVGYILRNEASAVVDLPEQEKLSDYALLSWQIMESSGEMAKQLNLTDTESIVVEGKTVKVVCICQSENQVSMFLEKTACQESIIEQVEH
jgi:hypothetical protein